MKHYLIPELSTVAGSCLTLENWEQVGVEMVSYSLALLLMKPGMDYLQSLPNLASYVGWKGSIVLNASSLKLNNHGNYSIRSQYDGRLLSYTVDELWHFIIKLSPQIVILPQGFTEKYDISKLLLSENIKLFFPLDDSQSNINFNQHGVYIEFSEGMEDDLREKLKSIDNRQIYVRGSIFASLLQELKALGVTYIESDKPSEDAYKGLVYSRDGVINLGESKNHTFDVIESSCKCPTCQQKLTSAYLHHLYMNTPLLCQRFLIQHNWSMARASEFKLSI